MKLQIEKAGTWKDCIGAISELMEEANFEFGEDAVEMKAMDPSPSIASSVISPMLLTTFISGRN